MENHFYHIRWAPLSVTIFITHVRILRNGSYANVQEVMYWVVWYASDSLKDFVNCTILYNEVTTTFILYQPFRTQTTDV